MNVCAESKEWQTNKLDETYQEFSNRGIGQMKKKAWDLEKINTHPYTENVAIRKDSEST